MYLSDMVKSDTEPIKNCFQKGLNRMYKIIYMLIILIFIARYLECSEIHHPMVGYIKKYSYRASNNNINHAMVNA
jgi:hypothetical protein